MVCPEKLWVPHPGGVLGWVGLGFEQPGVMGGVPARGRGVESR